MSGFFNWENGNLRLTRLLVVNVTVLLAVCALAVGGAIPLYPWMAIAVAALFVVDLFIAWRRPPQQAGALGRPTHVPKLLWLAAIVFTPAGIMAVFNWTRSLDTLSAAQALFACVLVGYIWFLVNRLRRGGKGPAGSSSGHHGGGEP